MPGWVKQVFVSHRLPFTLMAVTWFGGYFIHAHTGTPSVALYYVIHVFAGCALFGVGLFYLHPGKEGIAPHLISSDPLEVTRAIHRIHYYVLCILPITGVLVFFVPDSGLQLGKGGSFWLNHVYNDNFGHLLHGLLFYLTLLLGTFDFLFVLNKRRQYL
jgi:hypothetical protein